LMGIIYFVRHGETDWNRDRRVQGQSDTPLNDAGREQARALAGVLTPVAFDAAYSSDLIRATETAEIVLHDRGMIIQTTYRLRERNFGSWEGRLVPELEAEGLLSGRGWPYVDAPHGGESIADLETRVVDVVRAIASEHPNETILVVAHGGVIRSALSAWIGIEAPIIANCGVYVIGVDGNRPWLVEQLGGDLQL
jgi:broad specificity phosphatase PhoE